MLQSTFPIPIIKEPSIYETIAEETTTVRPKQPKKDPFPANTNFPMIENLQVLYTGGEATLDLFLSHTERQEYKKELSGKDPGEYKKLKARNLFSANKLTLICLSIDLLFNEEIPENLQPFTRDGHKFVKILREIKDIDKKRQELLEESTKPSQSSISIEDRKRIVLNADKILANEYIQSLDSSDKQLLINNLKIEYPDIQDPQYCYYLIVAYNVREFIRDFAQNLKSEYEK